MAKLTEKGPGLFFILYVALWVCGISALAVLGLVLVQRLVPWRSRQELNDVAGFIYAVVGVAYTVLLALVVIAAWEDHQVAKDNTESEANALAEIFWLGHWLPETEGQQLQELTRSYARTVVEGEWPLMEQRGSEWNLTEQSSSEASNPRAWELLDEIRASVYDWEPTTEDEQALYGEGLDRVNELADFRRLRLVEAEEGLPAIMRALVGVGAIVTVGFTYLFGLENALAHRVMVLALAVVLSLALVTLGMLQSPFAGPAQIKPEAFELILERFETSELSTLR